MGTDDVLAHIDATLDHGRVDPSVSWDAMRWHPDTDPAEPEDLDTYRVDVFGLPILEPSPARPSLQECLARYESMTPEEQAVVRAQLRESFRVVSRTLQDYFNALARAMTAAMPAVRLLAAALEEGRGLAARGAWTDEHKPLKGAPLDHLPPLTKAPRARPTTPLWVGRMDGRR